MARFLSKAWWKYFSFFILLYCVIAGFLMPVPDLPILNETIRAQFFHVPMWFAMMILMFISLVQSLKYLNNSNLEHDLVASEMVKVSILYGTLGLLTGMIWAQYTWGDWWHGDPKQNAAAISMLIYFAYLVLRNAIPDYDKRARIAAVYNIFAFFSMIALLFIVPRLTDSLHPGSGGNPGFSPYDLDATMRLVFYPAVIGWTLYGIWLSSFGIRIKKHFLEL